MSKSDSLFFISILLACVSNAQQIDTIKVNVHGHVMTLYASGQGKPTVILEAGGGSNHRTWQLVQPKLANSARVVSYDRPGYLNSDTCTSPRDAITIAKELKEALEKVNIRPPYIFAGWSYGGSLVRVFAGLYPKDVIGMVLVDPAPEEVYARLEKEFPEMMKEDEKYIRELLNSKTRPGEREEMRMYDSSMNQGRRSDKLHSTPTTLLIAAGKAEGGQDRAPSNPMNKAWIEELEKWGRKRPNLHYRIITNSGHHIARFQPDTVVHAIRYHIDQYQSKALKQSATQYKKPDQLNDGIQTATLKDVGLNEKIIQQMTDSIINGNYTNVHSVLIFRHNKLVYENYFPGKDEVRMKGFVGFVDHHRDSLHDIRSVTKSVVSALVMIAIEQGKLTLEERLFDYFPEYSRLDTGMKREIRIKHLLNMSSGLYWPEKNELMMKDSKHQVIDFILKQPLTAAPGRNFEYNSSSTQLLAFILEKATGTDLISFADKHLFQPAGIKNYNWVIEKNGVIGAWVGLRMRSRDLLKFGILYLNDGKWNGKQLISSRLAAASLKQQIETPFSDSLVRIGYGYQFWTYAETIAGKPLKYAQAQGNGGQFVVIDKQSGLVVVLTSGNYNLNYQLRKTSESIYIDFILPAINK
ncbi:alpha/beta fold hydrolase [Lacibacter sp. H375]|uniref:alpha/beta fold hydrolase n=1 Tax=Lacibacter sp. H375 TaxID=3133424 RepID=UPI0030BEE3D1